MKRWSCNELFFYVLIADHQYYYDINWIAYNPDAYSNKLLVRNNKICYKTKTKYVKLTLFVDCSWNLHFYKHIQFEFFLENIEKKKYYSNS